MKAYIFDLDGTLFDSLDVWHKIDIDFLQKRGIAVPPDYYKEITAMTFNESADYTIRRFGLSDSIDGLKQEWIDMAEYAYGHTVQMKPYAKEYITMLKDRGEKLAIATSLFSNLTDLSLRKHGIYDYFKVICTTEETGCGKSRPDVFLLTAKKLGVEPCDCIVFEDIYEAVKSAKSAGMTVCGVFDKSSQNDWEQIKKIADYSIIDFKNAPFLTSNNRS
ncbi:MAG: HAD family phosphatase [Treponema sp.]|nr:HAD family phosphatase [Treponema sp.]MCL2237852.1 HAD family phosphatase [Treponema sp.]